MVASELRLEDPELSQSAHKYLGRRVRLLLHKTPAELGVISMGICTRCQQAYYCSKDCQRAAWKAGHNRACRKPSDREVGDQMYVKDANKFIDLHGRLVELVEPNEEMGWLVRLTRSNSGEREGATFLVDSDTIFQIRPAK
jgi:hypothetical protein